MWRQNKLSSYLSLPRVAFWQRMKPILATHAQSQRSWSAIGVGSIDILRCIRDPLELEHAVLVYFRRYNCFVVGIAEFT